MSAFTAIAAAYNNHSTFEKKVIDVSPHPVLWILSCPFTLGFCPYQTTLFLETEEAIREDRAICGSRMKTLSYGELGSVERSFCCCFVCVDSNLGTLCPGWGCETALADAIAKELKDRVLSRGDTAQLKLSEKALQRANEINHKIDLITEHLKSAPPVSMEVSDR